MVKEMKNSERPRERLATYGVSSLSNEELLALLLRSGIKNTSVIELAKKVLSYLNEIDDLKRLTYEELLKIDGIKEAKATSVIAAIELGRRLSSLEFKEKMVINHQADIYQMISHEISHLLQEHFICLYLNIKSEIIKKETIFIGTISQTLIHPREIFKMAIKLSASSIIFVHNHPTGDSNPSKADLLVTNKLMDISKIIGIEVVDHIIIGKNEFYSIKNQKKTYM
jgi:DNA repair protein RadC